MSWQDMADQLNAAAHYAWNDEHRSLILEIAEHLPAMEMQAHPGLAMGSYMMWWLQQLRKAQEAEQALGQNIAGLDVGQRGAMLFDELTPEIQALLAIRSARLIAEICSNFIAARMDQGAGVSSVIRLLGKIKFTAALSFIVPTIITFTSIFWNWPSHGWVIVLDCTINFSMAMLAIAFFVWLARATLNEANKLRLKITASTFEATQTLMTLLQKDDAAAVVLTH